MELLLVSLASLLAYDFLSACASAKLINTAALILKTSYDAFFR